MCGFAGFTGHLDNGEEVLTNMMNKIIHREALTVQDSILTEKHTWALEDLVSSTLDNGSQPMYNENKKIVITFNGEIYNHQRIKKRIKRKRSYIRKQLRYRSINSCL